MPSQSLEQEALDRVARMYSSFDRRSRSRVPLSQPAAANNRDKSEPKPAPEPQPPEQELRSDNSNKEKSTGLLDVLLKDKEQSLILLLLVILMKDGADMNTVLALMYLLI